MSLKYLREKKNRIKKGKGRIEVISILEEKKTSKGSVSFISLSYSEPINKTLSLGYVLQMKFFSSHTNHTVLLH